MKSESPSVHHLGNKSSIPRQVKEEPAMGAAQFFIGMLCMFLLVLDCYFINNISTSARRVDLDVQTILELYEENKEEWIELDALLPDDMPTVTKNDETEVVDGMNEIAYLLNADEFEEEEAEEEDGRDDRDEQMGYATGQHRHRHIRKDNMQRENPIKNLHESAQNSNSPSLRQDQHYSRNNKHPITDEHKNDNNDRDDYDAGRTSEVDPMAALLGLDLDTMDLDTITNEELEAILADLVGMEALLLQVVPDNEEEVGAVPAVGGGDGQGLLPMLENGDEGEQGGKESNEGKCVACGQPSLHSGNTASVSSSSSPEEAAVATIESGAEENGSQSDTRNWNIPLPKAPAAPEGVDQGLFEEMFFAQYRKEILRSLPARDMADQRPCFDWDWHYYHLLAELPNDKPYYTQHYLTAHPLTSVHGHTHHAARPVPASATMLLYLPFTSTEEGDAEAAVSSASASSSLPSPGSVVAPPPPPSFHALEHHTAHGKDKGDPDPSDRHATDHASHTHNHREYAAGECSTALAYAHTDDFSGAFIPGSRDDASVSEEGRAWRYRHPLRDNPPTFSSVSPQIFHPLSASSPSISSPTSSTSSFKGSSKMRAKLKRRVDGCRDINRDLTRLNEFGYFEGWPLSVKYHTQRIDAIARQHAQLQRGAVQRYKKARHVYEKEKEHGRAEEKGGERKSDGESEKGTKTDDSRNPPPSSSVSSTSASASSASASSTASALPPLPGPTPTPRFFHGLEGGVDRYHVNDITAGEFRAWYEQRKVPVLLQGGMDDWELSKDWDLHTLNTRKFKNMRVRCGGYDDDEVETLETEEEQVPDFVFYNSGISANENIDDSIGQDQSEPDSASTAVFEREHIRLRGFLEYLALNDDDYPLYVFDDSFDIRRKGRAMLNDYRIPPFIPASLHRIFPEKEKPPYRWFLLGPARSGTNVHIDPLGTSAWNGLIRGRKRWVLFPPDADEALVKGLDFSSSRMEAQDTTTWFEQVLPRILAREREAVHAENQEKKANKQAYQQCCDPTCAYAYSNASESDSTSQQNQLKTDLNTGATASTRPSACSHSLPRHRTGIIEFIQYPGEIVFIPGGWWHAVINLDDTVAITENFITETNFDRGWRLWRKYYPHSTKLWRDLLDKHHPSQGRRARELDEEDGVDVEALYGKKGERRGRRNNDW